MPEADHHQDHPDEEPGTSTAKIDKTIDRELGQKKEDNIKRKTTPKIVVLKPPNKDDLPTKTKLKQKQKTGVGKQTKITSMFKSKSNEKNQNISTTHSANTRAKTSTESKDVQSNCSPVGDPKARMISPSTEHSRTLLVKTSPDLDNSKKKSENFLVPENNLFIIPDPND